MARGAQAWARGQALAAWPDPDHGGRPVAVMAQDLGDVHFHPGVPAFPAQPLGLLVQRMACQALMASWVGHQDKAIS